MPILTILEPEHFSEEAKAALRTQFDLVWRQSVSAVHVHMEPMADVVWTRLQKVDIDRYPNLKAIATNCTGTDHIDLAECTRRGIEVLSLKGIEGLNNVHATAEHTISLMLQALRHRVDRSSGRIGRELNGKNVGILGYGRIGVQVECLVRRFGAVPMSITPEPNEKWCDIITIHASLNETSRGLVDAEFLSRLKPGAIVVNTARHAIVDEDAILDWLDRDKEAIYAHDFLCDWEPDQIAWALPHRQIIATPHIGGWTIESLHKTEELLAEKVIEWAKSKMEVSYA